MNRIPNEECASICGLFCGACPAFPDVCHGCLSDYVRDCCKNCADHGFLDCAVSHNVTRLMLLVAMNVESFLVIS